MPKPYQNLTDVEVVELTALVRKSIISELPRDRDDDRRYRLIEPLTQRQFEIRRSEGFAETGNAFTRYFMSELTPNGRVYRQGPSGQLEYDTDERIEALEQDAGPNEFFQALEDLGISADTLILTGGGYSVDSKYLDTLEACAEAIVDALVKDERYSCYEPLMDQERTRQEALRARDSFTFWSAQKQECDAAMRVPGVLRGCYSMFGPLPKPEALRILSYLNQPTREGWGQVRGLCITGGGTLWQAWCANDPHAPRSGVIGFPSAEQLRQAITAAVTARATEIQSILTSLTPSGLRSV